MKKCVCVRPELVARIEFLEWTESDHLRHSKFAGLQEDKSAWSVLKEHAGGARLSFQPLDPADLRELVLVA